MYRPHDMSPAAQRGEQLYSPEQPTHSSWRENRFDPYFGYGGATDPAKMDWMREGAARGQAMAGAGFAGQQQSLAGYQAMAAGQGPSLATNLARAQTGQNIAAQQAMMAQGRGGAAAGQQRSAALAGQGLQAQSVADVAAIRAQEQQQAMAGAAGVAGQMTGMGLQGELGYAGNLNQANIAAMQDTTQFQLGQRALQEKERQDQYERRKGWTEYGTGIMGKILSLSDERAKHDIQPAGMSYGQANTAEALASRTPMYESPAPRFDLEALLKAATAEEAPKEEKKGGLAGLLSSLSDKRAKHGIEGADTSASELAGSMRPVSFEYNPGAGPQGRRVGILADDLERTPAGAALVVDTPQGKAIDTAQATNSALAMVADQEQRLRRLEGTQTGTRAGGSAYDPREWSDVHQQPPDRMSPNQLRLHQTEGDRTMSSDQQALLDIMQGLQERTTQTNELGGGRTLRTQPLSDRLYDDPAKRRVLAESKEFARGQSEAAALARPPASNKGGHGGDTVAKKPKKGLMRGLSKQSSSVTPEDLAALAGSRELVMALIRAHEGRQSPQMRGRRSL